MNYRELFINSDKITIFHDDLACITSVNEAIVLNRLNYWIEKYKFDNSHIKDDKIWIYNTYQSWKDDNFKYWSIDTVKRTFSSLKSKNLITTGNYNKMKMDRTIWYTINYEELERLYDKFASEQLALTKSAKCTNGKAQSAISNTNDLPFSTTESTRTNTATAEKRLSLDEDKKIISSRTDTKSTMLAMAKSYCSQVNYSDEITENVLDTIDYYFDKYHDHFGNGKYHPIMSNKTLINVIEKLAYGTDVFEDAIFADGNENYRLLIDEHFKKDYGIQIDYHMPHFATDGILEKLSYQKLY